MGELALFGNGGSGSRWLMLCRLAQVRQSPFFHGVFLDASPSVDDGLVSTEGDIGRREIADALVVSAVLVVSDEGLDADLRASDFD